MKGRGKSTPSVMSPDEVDFSPAILDVNALMAPFQVGMNLDHELSIVVPERQPVVPTSVVRELELLSRKGNDWRIKAALELSRRYVNVDIKGRGDAPIFNLALSKGWPVVTNDKRLRNKLLEKGIPVILVREKGHLELKEP